MSAAKKAENVAHIKLICTNIRAYDILHGVIAAAPRQSITARDPDISDSGIRRVLFHALDALFAFFRLM
jgi:hypothetical protein